MGPVGPTGLVRVYLEGGAISDAVNLARTILSSTPEISEADQIRVLLAEGLRLLGDHTGAKRERGLVTSRAPGIELLDAHLLVHEGDYAGCIRLFSARSAIPARDRDDVTLQLVVAQCQARLNELAASRQTLNWVMAQSERLRYQEGVADGMMAMALVDRQEGWWDRAEGLLVRTRQIYRDLGLSRKFTQATLNLGVQRLKRGQLSFAVEMLQEAVSRSREISDVPVEASARMMLGLALTRLGRGAEARGELARGLRLARRQQAPRRLAIALETVGEYHLSQAFPARARLALRRALGVARNIAPDGDIVPEVLRRLAEVELQTANAQAAMELAEAAATRARKAGDRYELATALRCVAEARLLTGDRAGGRSRLREALELLTSLRELFEADRVRTLLGRASEAFCGSDCRSASGSAVPGSAAASPETSAAADSRTSTAGSSETSGTSPAERSPRRRSAAVAGAGADSLLGILARHGMIGRSPALLLVMEEALKVARHRIPVLIQGETGTGKELLARALHYLSPWAEGPLVAFSCVTCPRDLLDAELFGHVRGAYTGARDARRGLVRASQGGTLFLDEVGELPLESQGRLLRLLDSGEVRPLGSDRSLNVETRIVSATNADLEEQVRQGRFRQDLFFRLAHVNLVLPPLRDRREDVPLLVDHYVSEARQGGMPAFAGFSADVAGRMAEYDWPGNIRQLRAEVLRIAALTAPGEIVHAWRPPTPWRHEEPSARHAASPHKLDPSDPEALRRLLRIHRGRVSAVARASGISRSHLYRLLARYGIKPDVMREDPLDRT